MDYHSKRFNIPVHNKRLTTQRLSKYMDLLTTEAIGSLVGVPLEQRVYH